MRKALRITGYVLLVLLLLISGLLIYVKTALPNVGPAPELSVDRSSQRIERGRYLATSVAVCVDCHSVRDSTKFSAPLVGGTIGKGGERFDQRVGFPGVFYARNITPAGISRYTDGELYRVITTGVNKEGKAMFPIMPYYYYGQMDPEDIKCIIAYIRTLAPLHSEIPASSADFPMNFILNTIPRKANPHPIPSPSDKLAYGGYLTMTAACIECHTPVKRGQIIPELAYSGGREFKFPDGSILRSSNISPDSITGIGAWTEDMFVNRFKLYSDSSYKIPSVHPGSFNTIMPWTSYAEMKKEDLAAIFAYLRHVKAIPNPVNKFTPGRASK